MSHLASQVPAGIVDDLDDNVAQSYAQQPSQQQPSQERRAPPQDIGQLLADTKTDESVPDYVPPHGVDGDDGNDEEGDLASESTAEDDGRERGMLVMELAQMRELFDHVPAIVGLIPPGVDGLAYLNAQPLENLRYMHSTAEVYIKTFGGGELVNTMVLGVSGIAEKIITKKKWANLTGMSAKIASKQNTYMKHAMAEMSLKYKSFIELPPEHKMALGFMMLASETNMENQVKSAIQLATQGGTLDPKNLTPEAVKAAILGLPK